MANMCCASGIREKLKSIFQMFCSICESCSQRSAELTNNFRNNFTEHRASSLPSFADVSSDREVPGKWGLGPGALPIVLSLLGSFTALGKCLQLVFKLISHAYNNDIMITFSPITPAARARHAWLERSDPGSLSRRDFLLPLFSILRRIQIILFRS